MSDAPPAWASVRKRYPTGFSPVSTAARPILVRFRMRTAVRAGTLRRVPRVKIGLLALMAAAVMPCAASAAGPFEPNDIVQQARVRVPASIAAPAPRPKVHFIGVAQNGNTAVALSKSGKIYAWGSTEKVNKGAFEPSLCIGKAVTYRHRDFRGLPGGVVDTFVSKTRTSPAPVSAPSGVRFTQVAAGNRFLMALSSTGAVYAWGAGPMGLKGNGKPNLVQCPRRVPLPTGVKIKQISAGVTGNVVALTSTGSLYEWGPVFVAYHLSPDSSVLRRTPTKVDIPSGVSFTWVHAGDNAFYARDSEGAMYAWGSNVWGLLGRGTNDDRYHGRPVTMNAPPGISYVAASSNIAVGDDGAPYTWGYNSYGQLGNRNQADRAWHPDAAKVALPSGDAAAAVEADTYSDFVVTASGLVYAWGDNDSGKLGVGARAGLGLKKVRVLHPTRVKLPSRTRVTQLAGGGHNNYVAVTTNGRIYGWGNNQSGLLGGKPDKHGHFASHTTPTLIG